MSTSPDNGEKDKGFVRGGQHGGGLFPEKKDKYEMPFDKGDGTGYFDFKGGLPYENNEKGGKKVLIYLYISFLV